MGSAGEAHTPAALPPPPKAAVLIPSLPALKVAKAGGGGWGGPLCLSGTARESLSGLQDRIAILHHPQVNQRPDWALVDSEAL